MGDIGAEKLKNNGTTTPKKVSRFVCKIAYLILRQQ